MRVTAAEKDLSSTVMGQRVYEKYGEYLAG